MATIENNSIQAVENSPSQSEMRRQVLADREGNSLEMLAENYRDETASRTYTRIPPGILSHGKEAWIVTPEMIAEGGATITVGEQSFPWDTSKAADQHYVVMWDGTVVTEIVDLTSYDAVANATSELDPARQSGMLSAMLPVFGALPLGADINAFKETFAEIAEITTDIGGDMGEEVMAIYDQVSSPIVTMFETAAVLGRHLGVCSLGPSTSVDALRQRCIRIKMHLKKALRNKTASSSSPGRPRGTAQKGESAAAAPLPAQPIVAKLSTESGTPVFVIAADHESRSLGGATVGDENTVLELVADEGIGNMEPRHLKALQKVMRTKDSALKSEAARVLWDRLLGCIELVDSGVDVREYLKLIIGDCDPSAKAMEALVLKVMGAKKLELKVVERFSLVTKFVHAKLKLRVAGELGSVLEKIQQHVLGHVTAQELDDDFAFWGYEAWLKTMTAFGCRQREAMTKPNAAAGGPLELSSDAVNWLNRAVIPGLAMRKAQPGSGKASADATAARMAELESRLAAHELDRALNKGSSSVRKPQACHKWDGTTCPFGASCLFQHKPGVDTRQSSQQSAAKRSADGADSAGEATKKSAEACWDFQKGKCKRGDKCRFKHVV